MNDWLREMIWNNWPRKSVAFITAVIVYLLVNSSISTTRTLNNVPVRIVDLPADMTVEGLLPSGYLSERITLTLTGSKRVLDDLEPGDIEVILDASTKQDQWVAQIGRNNLGSLNPQIDLLPNITGVQHSELILKLDRLITVKVPVTIGAPYGEPPKGYQFLDVWPQRLYHTISGPEDQVEELQVKGLELQFDLSEISKEDLDALQVEGAEWLEDEVSYPIPSRWKRVVIPFHANALEEINDPDASKLEIDFLKQEVLPLRKRIPVRVFFPARYSDTLNPTTYRLRTSGLVANRNGIPTLDLEVSVRNTSREFLDVVRDQLELTIIAAPPSQTRTLPWTIQVINPLRLEDTYVKRLIARVTADDADDRSGGLREKSLRQRFREYLRSMEVVTSSDDKLALRATLEGAEVVLDR